MHRKPLGIRNSIFEDLWFDFHESVEKPWKDNENTELMQAVRFFGKPRRMQALIDADADVHAVSRTCQTALHYAGEFGRSPEVFELLLAAGANVHVHDKTGSTPLCLFARSSCEDADEIVDVVRMLIAGGADVNARDNMGSTPLMKACGEGNLAMIDTLLANGADIHARNHLGFTPLMCALHRNTNREMVVLLKNSGADVTAIGSDGTTVLMTAAALNPNVDVLGELLTAGAGVNARGINGITALMLAACGNESSEIVKALIDAGADVDAADRFGLTALMHAARGTKNPETIATLASAGANVNMRSKGGWTPLMMAAGFNQRADVSTALITAGADVNAATTVEGLTPLMLAGRFNDTREVFCALLDAGADDQTRDANGMATFNHVQNRDALEGDWFRLPDELSAHVGLMLHEGTDHLSSIAQEASQSAFDRVVAVVNWTGDPSETSQLIEAFERYREQDSDSERTFSKLASAYLEGRKLNPTAQRQILRDVLVEMEIDPSWEVIRETCLTRTRPYVPPRVEADESPSSVEDERESQMEDVLAFLSRRGAFFPWADVDAARADSDLQASNDCEEAIDVYASGVSCQLCKKTGTELAWFYVRSPDWTWAQMCGRAGWMAVCDDCHHQVFSRLTS